jgi:hypothetical protein
MIAPETPFSNAFGLNHLVSGLSRIGQKFPAFSARDLCNFAVSYLFDKKTPLSLRSHALAVTLPGFAGEEYLPLPRSKGGAFPFLLTLGGCPTASANVSQGQRCSLETQEITENWHLDRFRAHDNY